MRNSQHFPDRPILQDKIKGDNYEEEIMTNSCSSSISIQSIGPISQHAVSSEDDEIDIDF